VVVEDVFVPAELSCSLLDPDLLNQPLSRMPFRSTLAAAAICVGIAQAAMDTLLELGSSKAQVEPQGDCAAGTATLYVDCPIEWAHRDIHAVTQHIMLAPVQLEDAGRVYFGLPPNNPLF
jgi:hypothetical protein